MKLTKNQLKQIQEIEKKVANVCDNNNGKNYDDWKLTTLENLENECLYCGDFCEKKYCNNDCKKAYEQDN